MFAGFMFFCGFFNFAGSFPVQNCNTQYKRFVALLDCRGEMEEQRHFMETFFDYMDSNTQKYGESRLSFTTMKGKKCSNKDWNQVIDQILFEYNETIPISTILQSTKRWKEESQRDPCTYLCVSITFLFNSLDSQGDRVVKEIVDNADDNRADNRFFIIQSSEKPSRNYSEMDFIHFTPSFKRLNIKDIFNKICDMNIPNTLTYSGRSDVKSEYHIVNQLSETSSNDGQCLCIEKHGTELISLESYDEFVDIVQYINNLSMATDTNATNLHVGFYYLNNVLFWRNGNPYLYRSPSSIALPFKVCFYLNLAANTNIIRYDKSLYNLGKYMLVIDCDKPLQHSLVVCESDNVIPKIYNAQLAKEIRTATNIITLTHDHSKGMFDMSYGKIVDNLHQNQPIVECKSYNFTIMRHSEKLICSNYINKHITNKINVSRNSAISILRKGKTVFYTLKKLDILNCDMYNECQSNFFNENDYGPSNANSDNIELLCADDRNNKTLNDTCSIRTLNLNFTLEYVQCESNKSQYSLKCIKDYDSQCQDNTNLQNCENFLCPEPFLKCFNSYCIFPEMIRNERRDCPHGEDDILAPRTFNDCKGSFILNMTDICLDLNSFQTLLPRIGDTRQFVCDNVCPNNYRCVSGKISFTDEKISKIKSYQLHIKTSLDFTDIATSFDEPAINSNFFSIVLFEGRNCKLRNFDYEFQYWKFKDLIVLDLSFNSINHSNYIISVNTFSHLKLLNLSFNENLVIDQSFNFPRSLEIIDLSSTKIKAFRNKVFGDLIHLRHLNLSHTPITQFKDMGLPDYFTLDTLYIQQIKIKNIHKDFFRGLTINSELMASDYVVCCPQILNANISADKCHAPIDFISSCKHLVGDTLKRIVIWIVGLLTLVSNGIVLVYRIGWNREIFKKAYGYFITGLAISDLFMGVYLLIIAIVDAYYKDVYVLEDFKWRNGYVCNVCGFLTTLSSEASTFFVCLITVDRFFCIIYPFGERGFSTTGKFISLILVWFVGIALAMLPVVLSEWEIYSSNGLCLALPFSPIQNKGWFFSFAVFVVLNFLLFLFIVCGQLTIFTSLIKVKRSISSVTQNNQRESKDLSVAKKLAFVAFTDFCCWFPIGILGFLSLNGFIFNREVYAWFVVFVLPINSALNPIIYTIPDVYVACKKFIIVKFTRHAVRT